MNKINMLEAKTNLTRLVRLLESNQEDEIIICRHGVPCAKLTYFSRKENKIVIGKFNHKYPEINWDKLNVFDNDTDKDERGLN